MTDPKTRRYRAVTLYLALVICVAWAAGYASLGVDPVLRAGTVFVAALVAGLDGFVAGREP